MFGNTVLSFVFKQIYPGHHALIKFVFAVPSRSAKYFNQFTRAVINFQGSVLGMQKFNDGIGAEWIWGAGKNLFFRAASSIRFFYGTAIAGLVDYFI